MRMPKNQPGFHSIVSPLVISPLMAWRKGSAPMESEISSRGNPPISQPEGQVEVVRQLYQKSIRKARHVSARAFSQLQELRSPASNEVLHSQPKSLLARAQSSTECGTSIWRLGL